MNGSPIITNKTLTAISLLESVNIKCLEANCGSTFKNNGNLYLHMLKHHKINIKPDNNSVIRYFCPESDCIYNELISNKTKYFLSKKNLRQHYMKVHAAKTIKCLRCDKLFSSLNLKNLHQNSCGQEFKCADCGWKYSSKEALITHCKRKKHTYKLTLLIDSNTKETSDKSTNINKKLKKIAPKITSSVQTPSYKSSIDRHKKSQTTQTKTSTVDIIPTDIKTNQCSNKFLDNWNKRITQPNPKDQIPLKATKEKFQNIDFFDMESTNLMCNSTSQTDKNLNNLNFVEDDSINYFGSDHCHIETQTELNSFFIGNVTETSNNEDNLDQMLYTHMHTQTCDDILSELGLSDIQTQTNWPCGDYSDLLVSTETQTSFSMKFLENTSTYTQTVGQTKLFQDNESSNSQSTYTQTVFENCLLEQK